MLLVDAKGLPSEILFSIIEHIHFDFVFIYLFLNFITSKLFVKGIINF